MAIIGHIDLDSFFASCERVRNHDLQERGIVICMYSGRGGDSGAVSTADYIAREYGIHAGMSIVRAKERALDADHDIAFLAADKTYYKDVSHRIRQIIEEHADGIEVASIDEAYVDLSSNNTYEEAERVVSRIRSEIAEQEQVTASAGIAPNKLVAKIASDHDKPDGQTVVQPDQVGAFLADLPVKELHGIGPKTAATLNEMSAETVKDLRTIPVQRLIARFGETRGVAIHDKAHGNGAEQLERREKKQLSRLRTLPQDTRNMADIRPVIRELAQDVHRRVKQREIRYSRIAVIMVTEDLETRTRSRTLKAATRSGELLFRTAEEIAAAFLEDIDGNVRRVGVRVGGLEDDTQKQLSEF